MVGLPGVVLRRPGCSWIFFHQTSLVLDGPAGPVGFLVGILSPADRQRAYIHFVGVAPCAAPPAGWPACATPSSSRWPGPKAGPSVSAVTAPGNATSTGFHQAMGFTGASDPVPDYNGPGRDLVVFERGL